MSLKNDYIHQFKSDAAKDRHNQTIAHKQSTAFGWDKINEMDVDPESLEIH